MYYRTGLKKMQALFCIFFKFFQTFLSSDSFTADSRQKPYRLAITHFKVPRKSKLS
ncbi:hypothetical protein BRYFOR_06756 [Marvinbryantia formatexigens DSM 14469]|uniref:Uncharacterized protein n=1 Tax=Marvinbryantia formatexigens DSM 14469 TaxID=478749 RepID=C6LDQ8_9FIRM|nr:hypothetical protein BRYFOR_06756 [Marvinbryantia formatexigens DSM 14469]